MPKAGGIPEKTNDFNSYLKTVIPHLSENRVRLNIYEDEMKQLLLLWGEIQPSGKHPAYSWNDLYKRKTNPLTSTSLVKQLLRAKRKEIDKLLRRIYSRAVYRMNPEDSAITGRRKRKEKNSRAPVPNRAPLQYVHKQTHSVITLHLRDPKFPSLRRNPPEFRLIQYEWEINMGQGKTQRKNESTGKSILRLRFEEKHTGKTVRIHSRYFNRRGEGAWSDWLSVFVI